jgi:hypothetical protein
MDPCPYVRVLVGNLALKMPVAPRPAGAGAGVHPTTSPCYCRIRLNKLPLQTAAAPLLPSDDATAQAPAAATGALAAAFHLSKADLDRVTAKPSLFGQRSAKLKVTVYAGRRGTTCGVNSGRLLGKVVISLDLKSAAAKPVVFHSGWVPITRRGRKASGASAQLNLTVRAEPDPRFVFQFDGEPECSPQVLQVQGSMRQPMFTCKFSCRSNSDLRSRSVLLIPNNSSSPAANVPLFSDSIR